MIVSTMIALRDRWEMRKRRRGYERKIAALLGRLESPLARVDIDTLGVRKYFPHYRNTNWHVAYETLTGVRSAHYIPEDLFYTVVVPRLNDLENSRVYRDKINLGFLLDRDDYVGNVFFRRRGHYHDGSGQLVEPAEVEAWLATQDEAVMKPSSESGGGRGVVIGPSAAVWEALQTSNHSVVIQKVLRQHPDLARFNSTSLNTIRLMSLRLDGCVYPLSAILRSGAAGSRVDNVSRGAVGCGIDQGRLRRHAFDIELHRFEQHPTSGIVFEGQPVPSWEKVVDLAVRCHNRFLTADIVSWDIAVGADGEVRLIEANLGEQELNGHQLLNGPVFAPYFDRLLGRVLR